MEDTKDVSQKEDLYQQLDEELAKGREDEPGASAEKSEKEKPSTDADAKEKEDLAGDAELSEEEISKLSPRAQKRIRDLAQKVKTLATPEKESAAEDEDKSAPRFKSAKEFFAAVQDEPSRKLLEEFHSVLKGELSSTLAPIERQNAEKQFEDFIRPFERIEGLSDLKGDLKKTFLRDPNQSLKTLVGEAIADLEISRVGRIEAEPSEVNRDGAPSLEGKSTDELYDLLESLKD